MTRRIRMEDALAVSRRAAAELEAWLSSQRITRFVRNVESDPAFQNVDVDLVWTTTKATYQVEIKADRWHRTGNFFFETHSNLERNTPGCLLYTEADLIFYYFLEPKKLFILPMPATRDWLLANLERFEERRTSTPVNGRCYTTVGRLVPIQTVLEEVPGVHEVTVRLT